MLVLPSKIEQALPGSSQFLIMLIGSCGSSRATPQVSRASSAMAPDLLSRVPCRL